MPTSESTPAPGNPPWIHRTVPVGEVTLHVVEAGPEDGPLVLLLHGFPEFWYSWRFVIPALAGAGFRVVAPDLRGYAGSDKPRGVRAYAIERLVGDIAGLIAAYERPRAHIVGHDWGGIVAWMVANDRPEVVERLVICNVPHPKRMAEGMLRRPEQMVRSWYIGFFQLPFVPERAFAAADFASLRATLRREPVRRGVAFTEADIERYVEAMRQPYAVTGPMNYYRAAVRGMRRTLRRLRRIDLPVLVLWGVHDRHLSVALADPPPELVPNARVVRLDASHWIPCDAPEQVSAETIRFLA